MSTMPKELNTPDAAKRNALLGKNAHKLPRSQKRDRVKLEQEIAYARIALDSGQTFALLKNVSVKKLLKAAPYASRKKYAATLLVISGLTFTESD